MNRSRPTLVQRALGGHAAIGLIAGALIYIVALTGTLIVIHDRWERWEDRGVVETRRLSPDAAQAALAAGIAADAGKPRTTHAYLQMPSDTLPRAVVTTDNGAAYVDATGRLGQRVDHPWTDFLVLLHETLTVPDIWGRALVGILGVMIVALTLTGVLAHPRIVRDAFTLRTRHDPQIARADWHNRLGVWTLPFILAVSVTGAFIGLGGVGVSLLARAYTGGDALKVYAPFFGSEAAPDLAPAPLADVATALRTLAIRAPDAVPSYVTVHDPGTRGQHIQILADLPRRLIYGESYVFDGRGIWRGMIGLSDGPLGQQAAASAYNLHFGNYAGLPVELAYMVMGLGLCVITATGVTLWLQKRRRRGLGGVRLTACWNAVIWGTPLTFVMLIWIAALGEPPVPLTLLFWGLLLLALIAAIARPTWVEASRLRWALIAATLLTAVAHAAISEVRTLDIAAMLIAIPLAIIYRSARKPAPGR